MNRFRKSLFCLATVGLASSTIPLSAQVAGLPNPGAFAESIARLVETATAGKGQVDVKIGEWDPRMQLAPCQRAEPVLLPGTRLWGKSQISIRCVAGAQWTVLLPLTVTVYGSGLVAKRNLPSGTPVQASDFDIETIELTRDNAQWVSDVAALDGKTLSRALLLGQAVRTDYLKTPPTVASGDVVKVRVPGEGFSITTDAVALANAAAGQSVRLRTESGKVLSGLVREGYVEIKP
jgi:flagellar basal body P-ring formation protein FlgA